MASTSARGPDAITASVPFSAPVTPPLTGQSICTMLRLERGEDALRHHRAGGGEIDEATHALAFDDALGAGRDREHDVGRRQARHHGLGRVGDLPGRAAATAPSAARRSIASAACRRR